MGIERGELYRQLDTRQRPYIVPFQHRHRGPCLHGLSQEGQGGYTSISILIGLTFADGGLAQQIHRIGTALGPESSQGRHGFLDRRTCDERVRRLMDVMAQRFGAQVGPEACPRDRAQAPMERTGRALRPSKVFLHDPRDHRVAFQSGQHIDEAEELDLEVLVLHAPVQQRAGPPPCVEHGRHMAGRPFSELPADPVDLRLERRTPGPHRPSPQARHARFGTLYTPPECIYRFILKFRAKVGNIHRIWYN